METVYRSRRKTERRAFHTQELARIQKMKESGWRVEQQEQGGERLLRLQVQTQDPCALEL